MMGTRVRRCVAPGFPFHTPQRTGLSSAIPSTSNSGEFPVQNLVKNVFYGLMDIYGGLNL